MMPKLAAPRPVRTAKKAEHSFHPVPLSEGLFFSVLRTVTPKQYSVRTRRFESLHTETYEKRQIKHSLDFRQCGPWHATL